MKIKDTIDSEVVQSLLAVTDRYTVESALLEMASRYINLLEKYNELYAKQHKASQATPEFKKDFGGTIGGTTNTYPFCTEQDYVETTTEPLYKVEFQLRPLIQQLNNKGKWVQSYEVPNLHPKNEAIEIAREQQRKNKGLTYRAVPAE